MTYKNRTMESLPPVNSIHATLKLLSFLFEQRWKSKMLTSDHKVKEQVCTIYCSSVEKMILLIALMYCVPSGCVIFSLVSGGTTPLVKYLNAGLGDWMASRKTLETKTNTKVVKWRNALKFTHYFCKLVINYTYIRILILYWRKSSYIKYTITKNTIKMLFR